MPIYEYRCETCGETNEFLVFGTEDGLKCKKCNGEALTKLMSAPNISVAGGSSLPGCGSSFPGSGMGGCGGSPDMCGNPGGCCGM
ncbi:MAG: FmdB family transcriptional regulator [Syntrophus sp. (in: bacteria)]|nr:FmdB family transcriptional regulator [Syntrophus sp. (in: bacteria)]